MRSRKICVVTAARSEYGLLRPILQLMKEDARLEIQLVVTGAHLLAEQGLTYREIEKDGLPIAAFVDMQLQTGTSANIAKSMGHCAIGLSETFETLKPDLLLVLGDRYELLPICSTALIMNIPIAHISGGDVTEGAIDDAIRNAVTMLADLHFPGTEQSAKTIVRMRGSDHNIFVVGEPGLDNFHLLPLMNRNELAENLRLDTSKHWVLMTYHSQTKLSVQENMIVVDNIITALDNTKGIEVVMTKANADLGGEQINRFLEKAAERDGAKYKLIASLGQTRYLSFMTQAELVIGNSSSGIVEAPYCKTPVVNIGDRQNGRHLCSNVVSSQTDIQSISIAINKAMAIDQQNITDCNYYGDGKTAARVIGHIRHFFNE